MNVLYVRTRRRPSRSDRAEWRVKAKEVYFTRSMNNHHSAAILVDGCLYGFNDSILTCVEFATGKMMWRDRSVGKAQ